MAGKEMETQRTPRTMEGAREAESDRRDGAGPSGAGEVMGEVQRGKGVEMVDGPEGTGREERRRRGEAPGGWGGSAPEQSTGEGAGGLPASQGPREGQWRERTANAGPVGAGRPSGGAGRWRSGAGAGLTPTHARRHNCVRVEFKDNVEEEVTLDRTTFVRTVMLGILRVEVADLYCLIALPGGRAFDVSFNSNLQLQNFLTRFEERAGEKPLTSMRTRLLSDLETKVVTVFLYNEALHDQDVEVWLRQHCVLLSGCKRVQDTAGIRTGARQWRVHLKTEGGWL
uniref:Zinc finger CCHC domain-containing protein 3-like n=1 Tax=Petromyzon marinus TaxID=7757 RepID=A0AAJ7TJR8_PETMA|nr:zinc finger CCHC domain-containing protein 3-like [Petromyzon marinus]